MPSDPDRVYVQSEKEAPNDALVRESGNGNLYYCPSQRGRNNHTGGNKENDLLESNDVDKQAEDRRVYVSSEEEAPDDVTVKEDDGSLFYRQSDVYDAARSFYPDNVEDEVDAEMPEAEMPEDNEAIASEEADEQRREDLAEETEEEFGKGRIYVDSPNEAPDDANVQEGNQGGYYYETGAGSEDQSGDGITDVDDLNEGQRIDAFGRPAEIDSVNEDGSVNIQYDDGTRTTTDREQAQQLIDDGTIEPETDRSIDPDQSSAEANMDVVAEELTDALAGTPGYDVGADPDATQDEVLQPSEVEEILEDRIDEERSVGAAVHQAVREIMGTGSRYGEDVAEEVLGE